MAMPSKLPAGALPEIVERYAKGESLTTLANELDVNRKTVYRWILGGVGDANHHDIVTACLVNRVADADQALDTATDAIAISRAREQARFYRMDLERRRPGLYGARMQVDSNQQVTVNLTFGQLVDKSGDNTVNNSAIEGTCTEVTGEGGDIPPAERAG